MVIEMEWQAQENRWNEGTEEEVKLDVWGLNGHQNFYHIAHSDRKLLYIISLFEGPQVVIH